MTQLHLGTDLRLTKELRYLFGDSRLQAILKASEISLCLLSGSLREYDLILDSDLCPETLMI